MPASNEIVSYNDCNDVFGIYELNSPFTNNATNYCPTYSELINANVGIYYSPENLANGLTYNSNELVQFKDIGKKVKLKWNTSSTNVSLNIMGMIMYIIFLSSNNSEIGRLEIAIKASKNIEWEETLPFINIPMKSNASNIRITFTGSYNVNSLKINGITCTREAANKFLMPKIGLNFFYDGILKTGVLITPVIS